MATKQRGGEIMTGLVSKSPLPMYTILRMPALHTDHPRWRAQVEARQIIVGGNNIVIL
jgi:hypothetical protein